MANYTQYIPQLNSTTYPISISDCFSALTSDVTALENDKLNLTGGILSGNVDIRSTNLTVGIDINTSGNIKLYGAGTGVQEGGSLDIYPAADYDTTVTMWTIDAYTDTLRIFPEGAGGIAMIIDASNNIIFGGTTLTIGSDDVVVKDATLIDGRVVTADSSGRITTTVGLVAADIATLSNTQTLTGDKTFSGTNTFSGTDTFTTIPAFNGGTSGATAPFTVDSTQIVTNLNADLLDGLSSTDYLRTSASNIISSGSLTLNNNIRFYLGSSSPFSMYYDGANSYVETTSGNIVTTVKSNSSYFRVATYNSVGTEFDGITVGGPTPFVRLYYGGVQQLRTESGGPILNATPSANDNSLKIATTAYADAAAAAAVPTFRGALVSENFTAVTVTNGIERSVPLADEVYDTDAIHDSAGITERLTVPAGVTRIILKANISWAPNNNGYRRAYFRKDGTTYNSGQGRSLIESAPNLSTQQGLVSAVLEVTSGDYFELIVQQNSGVNINVEVVDTWIAMEIIE